MHRFVRTDEAGQTVPDTVYADLTLAMRSGADPGAVFDALAARGQIRLHPSAAALQETLAALAAGHYRRGDRVAIVVDTGEQADELNAAAREQLVAAGRVDDTQVVTTRAGQRIAAGDRIATRRNDRALAVANRDTWTVTAVDRRGELTVVPADATAAAPVERMLPADYVTEHVQLAYASTAHGAQGDTVTAAHVVIGEHTGAASAYVGMTRGRTSNTAHLVATDLMKAREQWIAAFSRDRADLGPAHAAQLAAAEAARYALPRPLDQAVADLHAAWTGEQQCLDRLALAESRRDLLRHIREREAGDADRLTTLDASYGRRPSTPDTPGVSLTPDTSTAAVAAEADRLRDRLLTAWDAQRATASQAAQIVRHGPGRLGLRRAAVARASARLTAWADTWRPYLPYLPTLPSDPHRIAAIAGAADDRPRLQAAFDARVHRHAESFHPEHSELKAAADAARAAHDRARRELDHARRERRDRLARSEATGQPFDLTARLADAERDVAGTQQELKAARTRIEQLRQEPALLSQSADSLARERDRWRACHDLEDATPRPPTSPSVRPHLVIRPPGPEDVRHLARHPDVGLGTPR